MLANKFEAPTVQVLILSTPKSRKKGAKKKKIYKFIGRRKC